MSTMRILLFLAFLTTYIFSAPVFLDLGLTQHPSRPIEFAARVCAGLFNRNTSGDGVYVLHSNDDVRWLIATGHAREGSTNLTAFLRRCLHGDRGSPPIARGHLRYNLTEQKIIVPNIVTLAAVLDAVPLEDSQLAALAVTGPPILDLLKTFPNIPTQTTDTAAREATAWVFDRYANLTTGMAKMNPGLDVHGKSKLNPPLTHGALTPSTPFRS